MSKNTIQLAANGPVILEGNIKVLRPDGSIVSEGNRVALCRCGGSAGKPNCDGSHSRINFVDAGEVQQTSNAEGSCDDMCLEVTLAPNGPMLLKGDYCIIDANGEDVFTGSKGALCRCGASENRPFCDGQHGKVGFEAD